MARQSEPQQAGAEQAPSMITVEVLGYGGGESGREEEDREARLSGAASEEVL